MPKIHLLPPLLDDPEIADVLPMDDDSVSDPDSPDKTKKISLEQIRDFILGQFAVGNNLLINGNFDVWQRNTTFTQNDDLYIADRWNALQEANSSWTFARDTSNVPTGSKAALKCSNATANNQCAIVQILEARDAMALAGQNVSLSFYAKTVSGEIANLRCAILSWSGTEDAVTSDVISAWAQNGTNPTWATSWTMENTPANLALTNAYQKFTIENIAIDTASMKNIAVVIWVDDGTITSGDDFWVTQVMLNVGGQAADFTPRPIAQELMLCQRYYQKSYPIDVVPGSADGYQQQVNNFFAGTTTDTFGHLQFHPAMFATPTFTMWANNSATGAGTAARARDNAVGGLATVSAATVLAKGVGNFTSSGMAAGRPYGFNWAAEAEL